MMKKKREGKKGECPVSGSRELIFLDWWTTAGSSGAETLIYFPPEICVWLSKTIF